jgi:hypothetical protein
MNINYEELDKQGLLIVLPCKIGTPVARVVGDYYDKYSVIADFFTISMLDEFGKTVFLNKQDAEAVATKFNI